MFPASLSIVASHRAGGAAVGVRPLASAAGAGGLGAWLLLGTEGAVRNAFRRGFAFNFAIPGECSAVGSEGHSPKSGWDIS